MALLWEAKTAAETVERLWDAGSVIESASATATGATVVSTEHDLSEVIVTLSGGTNGTAVEVVVTAVTERGETLVQTFIMPVRSDAQAFTTTARDVVNFALRRIVGVRRSASSTEAADALERLNDMLAMWRIDGLDVGLSLPLTLGTELVMPDEFLQAIKYNLAVAVHEQYSSEAIPPFTFRMAEEGKRLIGNRLLKISNLGFPQTLTTRAETVADLF